VRASELTRLIRLGRGRAYDRHEDDLAAVYERVLAKAGRDAATRFRRKAGGSLAAAAPTPTAAMVAVYPDPEEAVLLAQPGGEPAEILHVTLAFLGELDPDQAEAAAAVVRHAAAEHGPLEGEVGGVASFGPEQPRRPQEEPQGAIFDVALEQHPDGGYGDTYWNAETRTVWWNPADWSTDEEQESARAAFLAIDGVDEAPPVEAESYRPEGDEWEPIWTMGMHGPYPSILLPDVVGLAELRHAVCEALEAEGIEYSMMHGWTPHMTVAYTEEPSPPPARLIGQPLTFDRLTLSVGDRPRDFPLGGGSLLAAAPRDCACGHAYRDHLGDDGPCEQCGCKTYRPGAEEAIADAGADHDGHPAGYVTDRALAAAAGMLTTYDRTRGNEPDRRFWQLVDERGWTEILNEGWPCPSASLNGDATVRQGEVALYDLGNSAAVVEVYGGFVYVRAGAADQETALGTLAAFVERFPVQVATLEDGIAIVPMTFWSLGSYGPVPRLRMIEVSPWEQIASNYAQAVRRDLDRLMTSFDPEAGKLILWQGEPGTGKTWALRALATEWADWADLHYITDPDAFFGEHANYMVDVLLHESDAVMVETPDGDDRVAHEEAASGRWRVVVLEDAGALLGADQKAGLGLSRLLNTVDGLIGQGLRVLVLVTTNDELGDLHPAVTRPGRCAAQIVFTPLEPAEVEEWTGEETDQPATLAELFERQRAGADPDDALTAAALEALLAQGGPAEWVPPHPDELVDADAVVSELRTKSDPIRRAAIAQIVSPAVDGVGLSFDATNPFVDGVVSRTGQHVTNVADTTRMNVNRIVRAAYEEGLSVPDTARAIQRGMAAASTVRARTIARTEMVGLTNGGALAAARIVADAAGIRYQKEWLTAAGAKYPRHALYPGLNHQRAELQDRFSVGGARLDYPGDPDGPADQTINCRCAVIMVEPEDVPAESAADLIPTTTITETPLAPIAGTTPDEFAASLIDRAVSMEPAVTRMMQEVSSAHGGRLAGLEFRLKGQESMARKIADDAVGRGQTLAETAEKVADGLRYTTLLEEARYAEAMEAILSDLERRGLSIYRFRNTWTADSPYVGVNVQLRAANGYRLELQFHTEASFRLKQEINHSLYERWRVATSAAERDRLWRQMMANAARVERPPGIVGLERGAARATPLPAPPAPGRPPAAHREVLVELDDLNAGDAFVYEGHRFRVIGRRGDGVEIEHVSSKARQVASPRVLVERPPAPRAGALSGRAAETRLGRLNAGTVGKLSDAELRDLDNYVGVSYRTMNPALRKDRPLGARTETRVTNINEAIAKSAPLDEPVILWRGLNSWRTAFDATDLDALVGKVVTDRAFASTTTRKSIAFGAMGGQGRYAAIIKIRAPAGQRGAWISGLAKPAGRTDIRGLEHHLAREEGEFLLPRGTRFRVLSVKKGRIPEIEVEIIP